MFNINIFLQNEYPDFNIDDTVIYNNTVKIADYIVSDKDIFNKSCLYKYKFKTIVFDIILTDNKYIQRINNEYRKKDSPTDVITFAMFADSNEEERFILDEEIYLGEIIISLDRIKEQSTENNISFEDELYFVISHGILHLLGFDHQSLEDYQFMVTNQNKAKAVVL